MKVQRVSFISGGLQLEGIWQLPVGEDPFPALIICHPHPLYGGNMDNNVVMAVAGVATAHSISAFRFNFRGVGNSQGRFSYGFGEQDDLKSALGFLSKQNKIDETMIFVAGYSFGGTVALPVAVRDSRVRGMLLVSPALDADGWRQFEEYKKTRLVILGGADTVVTYHGVGRFPESVAHYNLVPGADHSWSGYEPELQNTISDFFDLLTKREERKKE